MSHEPRLARELRTLLETSRVAALGAIQDDGTPFVSMVPFAISKELGCLVIHVSGLAAHTRNLIARSNVSLMVMSPESPDKPVHDLQRVTLQVTANVPVRGSAPWEACKAAYLQRFPDVEHMTELGNFQFVAMEVKTGRHVAGFGAARTVEAEELKWFKDPHSFQPG